MRLSSSITRDLRLDDHPPVSITHAAETHLRRHGARIFVWLEELGPLERLRASGSPPRGAREWSMYAGLHVRVAVDAALRSTIEDVGKLVIRRALTPRARVVAELVSLDDPGVLLRRIGWAPRGAGLAQAGRAVFELATEGDSGGVWYGGGGDGG